VAYSTRRPKSSQPLIAAFLAFGLFTVAYQFYDPPEPEPTVATPAPPSYSKLVRSDSGTDWDFSAFKFEYLSESESLGHTFRSALVNSQSVTREQLSAILIEQNTSPSSHASTIQNTFLNGFNSFLLAPEISTDPMELKQRAISILSSFAPDPESPHYNAQSQSITALVRSGSWQSSTGTLVYELATLSQLPTLDSWQDRVQIFERGHVLPGFMKWKHEAWHLYGLEMTVLGHGLKSYGTVSSLADQGLAIRIVSAPETLIWHAVSPLSSNAESVAISILRDTAERYNIPLRQLEENLQRAIQRRQDNPTANALPQTQIRAPWAFGKCFVPEGDFPLIKRDRIPSVDTTLPYPEILAARAINRRPTATSSEN
jgi:hypothetical protein